MAKRFDAVSPQLQAFIEAQQVFFVATAAADGRVNLSPKGLDSLRILSPQRLLWLNVTGSGNETAAHVRALPRMTLMFCAFAGPPMILRLYGQARVIHQGDPEWSPLSALLPTIPGARQIFDLAIDLVQTSCGMSVPLFDFVGERELLTDWARDKGDDGIRDYWREKNRLSLDGRATGILADDLDGASGEESPDRE